MKDNKSIPKCSQTCVRTDTSCPIGECKYWINYEKDHNCSLISIDENGSMTLQQIADRLGISVVRVYQIENKAKSKLKKHLT